MDVILAKEILSYADLCIANDIGILYIESTFLKQLDIRDRKKVNDYLLRNCKQLIEGNHNCNDKRYIEYKESLYKINSRIDQKLQDIATLM